MNKNQSQEVSVCSWCRHTYGGPDNRPIRKLSDKEYAAVKTHGVCAPCREEVMAGGIAARNLRGIIERGINDDAVKV